MTAALENVKGIEIEEWGSLNTAAATTKLDKGQTPNAKNVWVDEKPGSVITSQGFRAVGSLPSGNPCTFGIDYFKASTGEHLAVLSDNETVYTTVDFQNYTSIITGLSASFQLRGAVIRDKLWLTNGSDAVRTFDGSSVVVLDGTGTLPDVPIGRYIAYHDERVWIYHISGDRSSVRFSALTDATGTKIPPDDEDAWPTDNELQISEGDGDFGTGMILYRGFLHFFKQYSIWRLVGYDEYTYTRVKTRASTGTRFNESLKILDSLVHMIGSDGMYVFDGDETLRISDIIDPATAGQTAFGFSQIQQPNTNNQFWQTTATADFNAGTVSGNLDVADEIAIGPFDDSKSDFDAGATLTNVDTSFTEGTLLLSHASTGVSSLNLALNQSATITYPSGGTVIGSAGYLTNGEYTNIAGMFSLGTITINLISSSIAVTRIILKGFQMESGNKLYFKADGVLKTPTSISGAPSVTNGDGSVTITDATTNPITSARDITFNFTGFTASQITLRTGSAPNTGTSQLRMTEFEVYGASYETTGQFISRTLDLGITPSSSTMNFSADYTTPSGTTATFYTQSSDDGSTWDAAVAVSGGVIGSTLRRYLRWRVDLTSDGTNTPSIAAVYLPAIYISPIHDTAGSIFAWGPFESDYDTNGQSVNFYYRTATTSGGVSSASWNLIVPGGVVNSAVSEDFIQFKVEFPGAETSKLPVVRSVTINWVVGTGTQPQTLQNVASTVWRNRYWLSCAGAGATENDTILVRGKKTFGSPWQLKDWPILTFFTYFDNLYGGSSVDGTIYRLDTGYSKDGAAMDSFFETGDFTFGGFFVTVYEVLVEVERTAFADLSVGVSSDRGRTYTEISVSISELTYPSSHTARLNFSVHGDRVRFRVRTNGVDIPFQVHRLIAFYKLSTARGSIQG